MRVRTVCPRRFQALRYRAAHNIYRHLSLKKKKFHSSPRAASAPSIISQTDDDPILVSVHQMIVYLSFFFIFSFLFFYI